MPFVVDITGVMDRMYLRNSESYDELTAVIKRAFETLGQDRANEFLALFDFAVFSGSTIDFMGRGMNLMWLDKKISVHDAVATSMAASNPESPFVYDDEMVEKFVALEDKKEKIHDEYVAANINNGGSQGALFAATSSTTVGSAGGYQWIFATAIKRHPLGALHNGLMASLRKMGYTVKMDLENIVSKIMDYFS